MDLDALVFRVIVAYQSSSKSLWECAEYTWELFHQHGQYEQGFTETLCNTLAVQRDTIYHWRKAWDLRLRISEAFPNFDFSGLTISYLYSAADYVDRMGLEWVVEWLTEAREDGWSSRKLATEMDMATNESGTAPWLYSKLEKVAGRLERLWQDSETSGLPDHKRDKLRLIISMLKEIVE